MRVHSAPPAGAAPAVGERASGTAEPLQPLRTVLLPLGSLGWRQK